ncbi:MAG: hypothetical protein Q8K63_00460 [Acidimicrobiales bacterium]|nr:hypothetical protein [Acidimicrobiales bacterium]
MGVDLTWEDATVFHSCGFLLLGDARLNIESLKEVETLPALWKTNDMIGGVVAQAECDALPIEIGSSEFGVVAIRALFTDDAPDLAEAGDAEWHYLGAFRIADEAIACDAKYPDNPDFSIRLKPVGEAFLAHALMWDGDCLGVRILAELAS